MAIFCIVGTLPSSIYNFRGELIKEICIRGHSVVALASGATKAEVLEIESLGATYYDYPVSRSGLNPFQDLRTLLSLYCLFKKVKPDYIFSYTAKPVIWGGFAAKLVKCKNVYSLITGLGFTFQPGGILKSFLTNVVSCLYKYSLINSKAVVFQNNDNLQVFVNKKIVLETKCSLVNGSGVNLFHFKKTELNSKPTFLLIARLLRDKGVREYFAAAKLVKLTYPEAVFELLGPEDPSPNGIGLDEVNRWQVGGTISYLGSAKDVRPFISRANIFVLPSYHEGVPRTILEAMAMGRPILTTDVPGCRDTVIEGVNGFLVSKENVEQLAERIIWFINNPVQWQSFGDESFRLAKEKFDVHKVNAELIKIMGLGDEEII